MGTFKFVRPPFSPLRSSGWTPPSWRRAALVFFLAVFALHPIASMSRREPVMGALRPRWWDYAFTSYHVYQHVQQGGWLKGHYTTYRKATSFWFVPYAQQQTAARRWMRPLELPVQPVPPATGNCRASDAAFGRCPPEKAADVALNASEHPTMIEWNQK